jgi:hypothetical protein
LPSGSRQPNPSTAPSPNPKANSPTRKHHSCSPTLPPQ